MSDGIRLAVVTGGPERQAMDDGIGIGPVLVDNESPDFSPSWLYTLIDISAEKQGPVAQRLEQGTHNPLVAGSNPAGPTMFSGVTTPFLDTSFVDKQIDLRRVLQKYCKHFSRTFRIRPRDPTS